MILPAHVIESDMPPTNFRLRMRKWVTFFGVIQFLCVLGRIVVGDMMGALCMMFVVSMAYMISCGDPPMHIRWIFMWAFFCFINAGFDFAIASVRTLHIYHHYDDPNSKEDIKGQVPMWRIIVVLSVSWVGAISEIMGAYLGYKLYQDFQEQELMAFGNLGGLPAGAPMYGAAGPFGRPPSMYGGGQPGAANVPQGPGGGPGTGAANAAPAIQPFMGKGHKLEDN